MAQLLRQAGKFCTDCITFLLSPQLFVPGDYPEIREPARSIAEEAGGIISPGRPEDVANHQSRYNYAFMLYYIYGTDKI
jgi:hypothetical protein